MRMISDYAALYANLAAAVAAFIGVIKIWLKLDKDNERQNKRISQMLRELRVNTECNRASLQAHIDNGANGACRAALKNLDDFLNEAAHADE